MTIKDYLALPDDIRVELIDGKFYDMVPTNIIHQSVYADIGSSFMKFIKDKGISDISVIGPIDVQLNCDELTMVKPDVVIVSDRSKITKERIIGAPDLVVEVILNGNILLDAGIKLLKYKEAGVKEYWIIYPEEKGIAVYEFEKNDLPQLYTFDDRVPVGIWNGECKIDFKDLYNKIEFMYYL